MPQHLLDGPKRFSESVLWTMMRRFYSEQGVEAWRKGIVPCYITANNFIAHSYAKVVHAYLLDSFSRGEIMVDAPVYILELGAGSGKFSFLFLKALLARLAEHFDEEIPFRLRFIMTDFSSAPFNFWKNHPNLQAYFERGILDYARLDACAGHPIELEMARKTLNTAKNTPIVIANYLFDTLPADAFQVRHGDLFEGQISVLTDGEEIDRTDPAILNRFTAKWNWIEKKETNNNSLLQWYTKNLKSANASFLLSSKAFECLENLRRYSEKGHIVVISGDKGHASPISLCQNGLTDPHIAVHGSFSLMVNFHSIGLWFEEKGGFALHSSMEDSSLKVSMFVLDGEAVNKFPHLLSAFKDSIDNFGPDAFFHLQQQEQTDMKALLAMLDLSFWDAELVFKYRDFVMQNLPMCNGQLLEDLKNGMQRAWENYFFLEPEKDLAFELGRFYYGLHEHKKALIFYLKSSELAGDHYITENNIGLCHLSLGNKGQALKCFESCLELNPCYEKAIYQRAKLLQQEMKPSSPLIIKKRFIERELDNKSSQNSRHSRVSFDPEVLDRLHRFGIQENN